MSGEINVISRTQQIIVDPTSGSVAIINGGPIGPAGPEGPIGPTGPTGPEGPDGGVQIRGQIEIVEPTVANTATIDLTVVFDGEPKVTFWATVPTDDVVTWGAFVRDWTISGGGYSHITILYYGGGVITINFAVEGRVV